MTTHQTIPSQHPSDYQRLSQLTEQYSRFHKSALGLGHLYGALVLPLTLWLGRSGTSTQNMFIWAIFAALGLLVTAVLSRRKYQLLGQVNEQERPHKGMVWGIIVGSLAAYGVGIALENAGIIQSAFPMFDTVPAQSGAIFFSAVVGLLAMSYRTPTLGLTILLFAATLLGSRTVFAEPWRYTIQSMSILVISAFLIYLAFRQHREGQRILSELTSLRQRLGLGMNE